MRAYLLGYNHGKNDGYYSTLIERGGCEKSYDESLDVEYVELEKVLEIIAREVKLQEFMNDYRASGMDSTPPDAVGILNKVRAAVEALKEGEPE